MKYIQLFAIQRQQQQQQQQQSKKKKKKETKIYLGSSLLEIIYYGIDNIYIFLYVIFI